MNLAAAPDLAIPSDALILAGRPACWKHLLQDRILTGFETDLNMSGTGSESLNAESHHCYHYRIYAAWLNDDGTCCRPKRTCCFCGAAVVHI